MKAMILKAALPVLITAGAVTPQILYVGSNKYIHLHNRASNYISEVTQSALRKVGLTKISPPLDRTQEALINAAAKTYNLNPSLIKSLMRTESTSDLDAYSLKGAIGLMQIMPENAKRCGQSKVSKLWDDEVNINCGAQILSEELITYKFNLRKALYAYNGGPKCVKSTCTESVAHANKTIEHFAELEMTKN